VRECPDPGVQIGRMNPITAGCLRWRAQFPATVEGVIPRAAPAQSNGRSTKAAIQPPSPVQVQKTEQIRQWRKLASLEQGLSYQPVARRPVPGVCTFRQPPSERCGADTRVCRVETRLDAKVAFVTWHLHGSLPQETCCPHRASILAAWGGVGSLLPARVCDYGQPRSRASVTESGSERSRSWSELPPTSKTTRGPQAPRRVSARQAESLRHVGHLRSIAKCRNSSDRPGGLSHNAESRLLPPASTTAASIRIASAAARWPGWRSHRKTSPSRRYPARRSGAY